MGKFVTAVFWTAVLIGVVIAAARLTAIRWWQVPSDDPVLDASITPTLRGGDWILLWRATPPRFGSLVICPDPEDEHHDVIGRLVGEEGDKLTLDGASIQINDHEALNETACTDLTFRVADPILGSEVEQHCDIEALGGVLHKRGELAGLRQPQVTTRTVGEGKAFLVSDNRAFPYDSRNYGSLDRSTCKESIFFRLWSKDGFMDWKNRLEYIR